MAHHFNQPILRADPVTDTVPSAPLVSEVTWDDDRGVFPIPAEPGALLRLQDRSYLRWLWSDGDD